jgi:hypothetical protein
VWWKDGVWGEAPHSDGHRLRLRIDDSDIAVLVFSPGGSGRGYLYLGLDVSEVGHDFDDPLLNIDVDPRREAEGFVAWVRATTGRDLSVDAVNSVLARPGVEPDEAFVEDEVFALLSSAGIDPPPDDLG